MRLPLRLPALLLALATLLASLGAALAAEGRQTDVFDPARDAAVYRNGVLLPVDSTDLLHAALDDADGSIRGAQLRVVDLERMGFENVLFVGPQAHTVRVWGFVSFLEDRTALTALAVKHDPPMNGWDLGGIALLLRPDGTYDNLTGGFSFDPQRDTVSWTLREPVAPRPLTFTAFAGTVGCDSADSCLTLPRVSSVDAAPDGGAAYVASVQTFAWWDDVFPADEEPSPLHDARALLVQAWSERP